MKDASDKSARQIARRAAAGKPARSETRLGEGAACGHPNSPCALDAPQKASYTVLNRRPRRLAALPRVDGFHFGVSSFLLALLPVLMLAMMGACHPLGASETIPTASPSGPRSTPSPSSTPGPTATPTATSTPSPTPTPTRPPCLDQGGQLLTQEVSDPSRPWSMPFLLYLPACYAEQPAQRYPTIYLLHGLNYSEDQWADLGIVDVADALIASGDLPPIIMVMPRWENRRQAESAIVDFLMPQVEEEQRTRAERSMRAIGGISRGAGWAFRIGFKHGDLFSAIGLHSPAVDLIDVFAIRDWLRSVPEGEAPPRLWIDIGESDTLLASTLAILRALDKYGQPYVWSSSPGGHNAEYWSAHLEEYLLWYAEPWQAAGPVATQQPTP